MPELLLDTTPDEQDDLPHQAQQSLGDGDDAGQEAGKQDQRAGEPGHSGGLP